MMFLVLSPVTSVSSLTPLCYFIIDQCKWGDSYSSATTNSFCNIILQWRELVWRLALWWKHWFLMLRRQSGLLI